MSLGTSLEPHLAVEDAQAVNAKREYTPWITDKYAWYAGYGYHVRPLSILEIGVRYGYSAMAMLAGADGQVHSLVLVDSEADGVALEDAERRIHEAVPNFVGVTQCVRLDTQMYAHRFRARNTFCLVHIDGFHSYDGCMNDLMNFGRLARDPDGVIVVDDAINSYIERACRDFAEGQGWRMRYIPTCDGHIVMVRDA